MDPREAEILDIAVRAMRALATQRWDVFGSTADALESRLGRKVSMKRPSADECLSALFDYKNRYGDSVRPPSGLNFAVFKKISRYELRPNFREVDWASEPEEFRPDFDPDDFPRELDFYFRAHEHIAITTALTALAEPEEWTTLSDDQI